MSKSLPFLYVAFVAFVGFSYHKALALDECFESLIQSKCGSIVSDQEKYKACRKVQIAWLLAKNEEIMQKSRNLGPKLICVPQCGKRLCYDYSTNPPTKTLE